MTEEQRTIANNISRIRERISDAASKAGRSAENICMIAVSKYVEVPATRAVALAGIKDIGESRPQNLWGKAAQLSDATIRWHLVGHLQRNKVAKTISESHLIHSVDSERLLDEIDQEGMKQKRITNILLEINISEDENKHGFSANAVPNAIEHISTLRHIRATGLMAMSSRQGGCDVARKNFSAVREIRDRLSGSLPDNVLLDELSLGMSGDFEDAILEGATMIRVGKALFTGL